MRGSTEKERPNGQVRAQAARLFDRHPTPVAVLVNSGNVTTAGPRSKRTTGQPGASVSRDIARIGHIGASFALWEDQT